MGLSGPTPAAVNKGNRNGIHNKKKTNKKEAAMTYKIEHKGKTVELPDFKELPVGVIRKARKESPDEMMWVVIESVLDAKTLAVIDTMSVSQFNEAMTGWTQGAPLGESLQSSKS